MNPEAVMLCHHGPRLVVLSILISMITAFAARELIGRITSESQGVVLGRHERHAGNGHGMSVGAAIESGTMAHEQI